MSLLEAESNVCPWSLVWVSNINLSLRIGFAGLDRIAPVLLQI